MNRKEYRPRLTSCRLHRKDKNRLKKHCKLTLLLAYQPPYAWEELLSFLAARMNPGVESVSGQVYRRTVVLQKAKHVFRGWICVANSAEKNSLIICFASALLPALSELRSKIHRFFDLDCQPTLIYEKLKTMNDLRSGLCVAGMRLPGCFDPFELAVRAVLGQQVTVKAARTLAMRFTAAFGEEIVTPFDELKLIFPSPARIVSLLGPIENHLGPLGIIGSRARAIFALAEAITSGSLSFSHDCTAESVMEQLLQLPGFGPWTVQYIAMRALAWPDAFPHTDFGVKKALPGLAAREILLLAEDWRPWRSYATFMLWRSLH